MSIGCCREPPVTDRSPRRRAAVSSITNNVMRWTAFTYATRLRSSCGAWRQHHVELLPRPDVELCEDLVEVIFDGAGADVEPRADLGVGQAVAGEPRDLGLL